MFLYAAYRKKKGKFPDIAKSIHSINNRNSNSEFVNIQAIRVEKFSDSTFQLKISDLKSSETLRKRRRFISNLMYLFVSGQTRSEYF